MKYFSKVSSGVDVTPLKLAIARRPELWQEFDHLKNYPGGPFKDIDTIAVRFPQISVCSTPQELEQTLLTSDQHESINYPACKALPEARPLYMNLMAYIGGERLGRVLINRIPPGKRIDAHEDTLSHAEYYSRFHIVLQSAPGVVFRAGNEQIYMAPGEVWWFDNSAEHEVINNSADDRIHMVVDIRTFK